MALARTLALILMAAATPALAQAQAAKAPAPKPSVTPPAATAKPAAAPAGASLAPITNAPGAAQKADDWPAGAPHTDYEFTAWCYGVLRTHMELYERVKPELLAISKRWKTEEEDAKSYSDQLAAGKVILADFSRAIELAEKASPKPINAQGAAAIEQGRKMWSQFETVDRSNQAYSWMNWELPEKCPKVAAQLENKALLASPALKSNLATKPPETRKPDAPVEKTAAVTPKPAAEAAKSPAPKPAETKPAETKVAETRPTPAAKPADPAPSQPVKLRPGKF